MRRIVSTALGALLCAAPALAQAYRRVELVYQHVPFDLSCEQWRNTKIEQSWKEAIESKIAAYQEFWNKEAPLLLEAVVSEVGKPFQRKEMLAVLTLCPISSMSTPLVIGIGRFLDGPTQGNPRPVFLFSAELFHELLHTYIRPFPPPNSKRSEEHTSELQSQSNLVCRLLLEKKNKKNNQPSEDPADALPKFDASARARADVPSAGMVHD